MVIGHSFVNLLYSIPLLDGVVLFEPSIVRKAHRSRFGCPLNIKRRTIEGQEHQRCVLLHTIHPLCLESKKQFFDRTRDKVVSHSVIRGRKSCPYLDFCVLFIPSLQSMAWLKLRFKSILESKHPVPTSYT
jgi:hypothetical protein